MSNFNNIAGGAMVEFSHETRVECKHRPVTPVSGWVTARVFNDKSSPHIHTRVPILLYPAPTNGY